MGESSLRELENDVEMARSKLARDLSTLRSPNTYSEFTSTLKQEAMSTKDAMLSQAKTSVQSTVESFVEDLKAKAAANPAAALAIGAGIAWRVVRRPPIATALIGAGLYSLMRTNPARIDGRSNADYIEEAKWRLREQAGELAENVKERAQHALEAGTERVSEMAASAKEQAAQAVGAATERLSDTVDAAKERVQEFRGQAASAVQDATDRAKEQATYMQRRAAGRIGDMRYSAKQAGGYISDQVDGMSTRILTAMPDREGRDTLLLGAAGLAVIAALGIACQRSLSDSTHAE
jgi:ElaB/YqjD/DUF883 family membrane-anchored ribosome-binding protein